MFNSPLHLPSCACTCASARVCGYSEGYCLYLCLAGCSLLSGGVGKLEAYRLITLSHHEGQRHVLPRNAHTRRNTRAPCMQKKKKRAHARLFLCLFCTILSLLAGKGRGGRTLLKLVSDVNNVSGSSSIKDSV